MKVEHEGNIASNAAINVIGSSQNINVTINTDNLSNKCEENISNKGEQDNDDISAKSFKSKRSEGLVDTASMKSLIIDNNYYHDSTEKSGRNNKNILFVDHSEAHSVKSAKNYKKEGNAKSNYYYNNQ